MIRTIARAADLLGEAKKNGGTDRSRSERGKRHSRFPQSRRVVEFHGSLNTFTCLTCHWQFPLVTVLAETLPPACNACGALLKPDVVFFGETIPAAALEQTAALLAGSDLLLLAGTSCQMAPASSLPHQVRAQGGRLLEIDPEPALAGLADLVVAGGFCQTMVVLVTALGIRL
jgi:NAD-dependent deacetylase